MRAASLYIWLAVGWWCLMGGSALGQSSISEAVQTHLDAAVSHYNQDALDAAEAELEAALRLENKTCMAHYWKGMIALKRGNPREAEKAFRRASQIDKNRAEPYYGIGLAYSRMNNRRQDALNAFKQALKLDPDYVDAQYALASTYFDMSIGGGRLSGLLDVAYLSNARKALEQTIRLDPEHPTAHYNLGVLYEDGMLNVEKAIPYYIRQLQINPDKTEAVNRLGLAYFKTRRYEEGVKMLSQAMRWHPSLKEAIDPMLSMLQISMAVQNRQYARAEAMQEKYLASLPEEERGLYEDITTVASNEALREYRSLSPLDQAEYRRRFWKQRDPDPTTLENERLIEHFRRVMFARAHFGKYKFPWDRRGDLYIRYGEPDDRQQFTFAIGEKQWTNQGSRLAPSVGGVHGIGNLMREAAQSHALERSSFAPTGKPRVDAIREMNMQQRYQLGVEASTIGVTAYKVESWVYVPMNAELFFVDQLNNGVYDFPLMTESRDVHQIARQAEYHPAKLAQEMAEKLPERYYHDYGGEPMQFFFDIASFRGEGNHSEVEVAIGVPMKQLGNVSDGRGGETLLDGRVAFIDAAWYDAAHASAQMGPFERPAATGGDDAATELTTFQLPVSTLPGDYTIGVSVRDAATRKIGIYRQKIAVPSYTSPYFMLSDIKLASSIRPVKRPRGAFVRNNLEIVPNPTRTFAANQPLHLYYELYNLKQNPEGNTQFETQVTVTAREPKRNLFWRVMSGFGRLVEGPSRENALTFTIYDASQEPDAARYTEIDLSESPPGPYTVEVSVTDVLANRTATKTAEFVLTDAILEPAHASMRWDAPARDAEPADAEPGIVSETAVRDDEAVARDSTRTASSLPDRDSASWDDLLRVLRTPDYTIAVGDSAQSEALDTTVATFVSNLAERAGAFGGQGLEDDPYKDMIYIPSGMFLMGSDDGNADESPMQSVFVEAFYIDRYEVTNEEYKAFLDATGHDPPRHWKDGTFPPGEARYPVTGVSWYDAQAYLQWKGKRLPTEAEWEKAARGDDGRVYPWGDAFIPEWLNINGDGDLYEMTAPVGSFPQGVSPYGVFDMAGNVWEWTADWYVPYEGNTRSDPAYGERYRVIRGGSWVNYDGNTRTTNRGKYYPGDTSLLLGFRGVKNSKANNELLAAKGYGYLLVATPGTWADIYVDGEKLGQTPQADPLRLRPGNHTLTLVNPYYQVYERTIDVETNVMKKERAVLQREE